MSRRRQGFTMIEVIVVVAIIAVLISLLLPAVQSAREAARRTQCANNLLQLGIAIQNYESTHQVLPPGVVNPTGPIVESAASYQFGWITQILPYLEQKNLYKNLDFNVGIYQAANLTARSISINTLLCPSEPQGRSSVPSFGGGLSTGLPDPAQTTYAACHNDVEAPIDADNRGVFFLNSHVRTDEIEDGLTHTIFLGEKRSPGDELGWASGTRATLRNTGTPINGTRFDPTNLSSYMVAFSQDGQPSDPGAPDQPDNPPGGPPETPSPPATPIIVGGFGSFHPSGANFLFGDGSVRFLRTSIDGRIYRLLGNRADGEPIGDDQF